MDTLYNEGKYDELADLVYYELINDKDCVLYEWEHYQFIDTYGSQIIRILKDVVIIEQSVLKINPNLFENKEDYEKAIINTALEKLIENSEDFGIDPSIVGIFDVNTLTNIIHSIFVSHKIDIYSSIEPSDVAEHSELYDEDVAAALKGAE